MSSDLFDDDYDPLAPPVLGGGGVIAADGSAVGYGASTGGVVGRSGGVRVKLRGEADGYEANEADAAATAWRVGREW